MFCETIEDAVCKIKSHAALIRKTCAVKGIKGRSGFVTATAAVCGIPENLHLQHDAS